ncbi:MAG TPA: hypothetical protein VF708_08015 [Pyrinomonadaceae bacterium]
MIEKFTLDTFTPHLNSTFRIKQGDTVALELQLVGTTDVGTTPRQIQFSIVFRGPQNPYLVQSIYRLEHDQLGAFDLFLVPIKRDQEGMHYEAIFNRPL